MAQSGTAFFMYHELALPGRAPCRHEPGYTRYVVSAADFRGQMESLAGEGGHGTSVGEGLLSGESKCACITFDDGCETDLLCAAPILKELGFQATFYLTVNFLGRPGYLSREQVRSLVALGFEIGCHSQTHPYLTDVEDSRLRDETAGAKDRLEQIAGVPVEHFSCPGGRWDRRVVNAVKAAKFRTMATSRTGLNRPGDDLFALRRIAVLAGTTPDAFSRACHGEGLLLTRLKENMREAARSVLGNSKYDRLRGVILGRPSTAESARR